MRSLPCSRERSTDGFSYEPKVIFSEQVVFDERRRLALLYGRTQRPVSFLHDERDFFYLITAQWIKLKFVLRNDLFAGITCLSLQ
jgi:hypothetical protein